MIEFRPLASSSNGCCYHVSGGGARHGLLIDAGIRMDSIRRGVGFRLSTISGCLVSHGHGDHSRSAADLTKAGVDVYASEHAMRRIPGVGHRLHMIQPGTFAVGEWTVTAFQVVHDEPGTYGFVVDGPEGGRLLYLTDTLMSRYRFDGLTHVAVECNHSESIIRRNAQDGVIDRERYRRTFQTHMSLERLIELLKANDLRQVEAIYLMHLSRENADEAEFKKAVARATGKPVYVCAERGGFA